ncbi:MAG: tRNA (adenosine(37)-N6)-threonylcarbamoyltransferase complex ATPase subunit type 1 TsaE [Actinomycetota bacterium]
MTTTEVVADPEAMRTLGQRIGRTARAGDVIVLDGELGTGKTTLTQGIAQALGVTEPVTSPTFVIARIHPSTSVPLVHVDAYRLARRAELDDLDLPWEESVSVVEWGGDWFPEAALHVFIDYGNADQRVVVLNGRDERWTDG